MTISPNTCSIFCSIPLNKDLRDFLDGTIQSSKKHKYFCLYCERSFLTTNLRLKHVERCHSGKQNRRWSSRLHNISSTALTKCFICDITDEIFILPNQLFKHLIISHSDKYFACYQCQERYSSELKLFSHNQAVHSNELNLNWKQTFNNDTCYNKRQHNNGLNITTTSKKLNLNNSYSILKNYDKVVCHDNENAVFKNCEISSLKSTAKSWSNTCLEITFDSSIRNKPYNFLEQYRLKNITDHDMNYNPISFDDVFDQQFFNKMKDNIQENLLNYLDGKLVRKNASEKRMYTFEVVKEEKLREVKSTSIIGYDQSTSSFPLVSNENKYDNILGLLNEKTCTDIEIIKSNQHEHICQSSYSLENKENAEFAKLDIWTQLMIKKRLQKIEENSSTQYTKTDQRSTNLGKTSHFEDTQVRVDNNEKLENVYIQESYLDIKEVLDDILTCISNNFVYDGIVSKTANIVKDLSVEIPSYLNLKSTCTSLNAESNTTISAFHNTLLSGESTLSRLYVCAVCGLKLLNMNFLVDHIRKHHINILCQYYEFFDHRNQIYKYLSIPSLGNMGELEQKYPRILWRRSDARSCSKCMKQCNSLGELHRHILECGEDWNWMTIRKKTKYRPFGAKSRRRRKDEAKIPAVTLTQVTTTAKAVSRNDGNAIVNRRSPRKYITKEKKDKIMEAYSADNVSNSEHRNIRASLRNYHSIRNNKMDKKTHIYKKGRNTNKSIIIGNNATSRRMTKNNKNSTKSNRTPLQRPKRKQALEKQSKLTNNVHKAISKTYQKYDISRNCGIRFSDRLVNFLSSKLSTNRLSQTYVRERRKHILLAKANCSKQMFESNYLIRKLSVANLLLNNNYIHNKQLIINQGFYENVGQIVLQTRNKLIRQAMGLHNLIEMFSLKLYKIGNPELGYTRENNKYLRSDSVIQNLFNKSNNILSESKINQVFLNCIYKIKKQSKKPTASLRNEIYTYANLNRISDTLGSLLPRNYKMKITALFEKRPSKSGIFSKKIQYKEYKLSSFSKNIAKRNKNGFLNNTDYANIRHILTLKCHQNTVHNIRKYQYATVITRQLYCILRDSKYCYKSNIDENIHTVCLLRQILYHTGADSNNSMLSIKSMLYNDFQHIHPLLTFVQRNYLKYLVDIYWTQIKPFDVISYINGKQDKLNEHNLASNTFAFDVATERDGTRHKEILCCPNINVVKKIIYLFEVLKTIISDHFNYDITTKQFKEILTKLFKLNLYQDIQLIFTDLSMCFKIPINKDLESTNNIINNRERDAYSTENKFTNSVIAFKNYEAHKFKQIITYCIDNFLFKYYRTEYINSISLITELKLSCFDLYIAMNNDQFVEKYDTEYFYNLIKYIEGKHHNQIDIANNQSNLYNSTKIQREKLEMDDCFYYFSKCKYVCNKLRCRSYNRDTILNGYSKKKSGDWYVCELCNTLYISRGNLKKHKNSYAHLLQTCKMEINTLQRQFYVENRNRQFVLFVASNALNRLRDVIIQNYSCTLNTSCGMLTKTTIIDKINADIKIPTDSIESCIINLINANIDISTKLFKCWELINHLINHLNKPSIRKDMSKMSKRKYIEYHTKSLNSTCLGSKLSENNVEPYSSREVNQCVDIYSNQNMFTLNYLQHLNISSSLTDLLMGRNDLHANNMLNTSIVFNSDGDGTNKSSDKFILLSKVVQNICKESDRKSLTADEELFLECCSLLKTSVISKNMKLEFNNDISEKQSTLYGTNENELSCYNTNPEMFNTINYDKTNGATPTVQILQNAESNNTDEAQNSCSEKVVDSIKKKDNTLSYGYDLQKTKPKKSSKVKKKKIINKRKTKKYLPKKIKVSIPTNNLNMEDVLHYTSSIPSKSKEQSSELIINDHFEKLKSYKNEKELDIYNFEETEETAFSNFNLMQFRISSSGRKNESYFDECKTCYNNKNDDLPKNKLFHNYNCDSMTDVPNNAKKIAYNKNKSVIMDRIFKKSKGRNDIKQNCNEKNIVEKITHIQKEDTTDTFISSNTLFDNMLNEYCPNDKVNDNSNVRLKRKTNMITKDISKRKKRHRLNSNTSDDEFYLRRGKKKCSNLEKHVDSDKLQQEYIGVANRKSQRKCATGKQNILLEYWSSDDSNFGNDLSTFNKIDNTSQLNVIENNTEKNRKKPTERKKKAKRKHSTNFSESKIINESPQKRSRGNTLYYWPSSSDEDCLTDETVNKSIEKPVQHGWIVGESPKKLVTMLAYSKGRRLNVAVHVKEHVNRENEA